MATLFPMRGCIGDDWRAAVVYAPVERPIRGGCSASVLMVGVDGDRPYLGSAHEPPAETEGQKAMRHAIECSLIAGQIND